MMSTKIIGRESEIKLLQSCLKSNQSELVALFGRRRVGKTFLVKEVFGKQICFEFFGVHNATLKTQLNNFYTKLVKIQGKSKAKNIPSNWVAAFDMLQEYVKSIKTKEKKIIFIDEMPWLDTTHSGFLSAFEYFWNSWAAWQKNIVIVICGSASSWMLQKIFNNKGGLHNRVTKRIRLMPFSLLETEFFLKQKNIKLDRYQLVQLYMIMGGVPFYLNEIDRSLSLVDNINKICFSKDGLLKNEYVNLYHALFKKPENHIAIINALAKKQSGLSRQDLIAITKLPSGGTFTTCIQELIESGFVSEHMPILAKTKNTLYRLCDEYSLFYIKFIETNKTSGGNVWSKIFKSSNITTWQGYAFENICIKHSPSIKHALGIAGIQSSDYSWRNKEAQIDLIIDRLDDCMNICELKFYNRPYTITNNFSKLYTKRLDVFLDNSNTQKQLIRTFITSKGIVDNVQKYNIVDADLDIHCLFNENTF